MDFKKDKKRCLVNFVNEVLHYNTFLINDTAFFKFIYLFRHVFSKLNPENKLATFENILLYLKNRIGDPDHTAYKQVYNEFYFMPRYLYNKNVYYALDFEEILKACRTTLIILIHDLPDENIESMHTELEKEIGEILNRENHSYVYKVIERDSTSCPENFAKYINNSQKKLIENSLRLINEGASSANLRFLFNQIGISSNLANHTIEKIELITPIPEQNSYDFGKDFINRLTEKNKKVLQATFKHFGQTLPDKNNLDFYSKIGWSRKFVYKTLGDI